jgi:hypothetical protein
MPSSFKEVHAILMNPIVTRYQMEMGLQSFALC